MGKFTLPNAADSLCSWRLGIADHKVECHSRNMHSETCLENDSNIVHISPISLQTWICKRVACEDQREYEQLASGRQARHVWALQEGALPHIGNAPAP